MTALTSSSPTLTPLSIFARCSRRQAISPSIWRRIERIEEPCDFEIVGHLLGRLLHVAGDARDRLVDVGIGLISISSALAAWICSVSSIRLRSTCWRKRVDFVGRDLAAVGDRQQREPLVDVGLGDDLAVDDRGRLDDRRHAACRTPAGFRAGCSALVLLALPAAGCLACCGRRQCRGERQRERSGSISARAEINVEYCMPRSKFP